MIGQPCLSVVLLSFTLFLIACGRPTDPIDSTPEATGLPIVAPTPSAAVPDLPATLLEALPMAVGTTRHYSVTVEYQEGQAPRYWQGTVTETIIDRARVEGGWLFRVREEGAHPFFADEGVQDRYHLVLGNRLYQLWSAREIEGFLRAREEEQEPYLLYVWPMAVGDRWGNRAAIEQERPGYSWDVIAQEGIDTPLGYLPACYQLRYQTNPDHTIVWFCPGVGLVRREYVHHGSLWNEIWQLEQVEEASPPSTTGGGGRVSSLPPSAVISPVGAP